MNKKSKYQETIQTWDKLAEIYADSFMGLDIYNDSYDRLLRFLPRKDAKILELSCGPGMISKYLFSKNSRLRITATDVSENMITLAKENLPHANCFILDCRDVEKIDATFDGIICGFGIPYLDRDACTEMIHVCISKLNPNGLIYLSFVEGDYKGSKYLEGNTGDRSFFYFHSLQEIKTLLSELNLQILNIDKVPYSMKDGHSELHTILIAQLKA